MSLLPLYLFALALTTLLSRLLSIKKITVSVRLAVKLDFTLSKGTHQLKLYLISDSYMCVFLAAVRTISC